MSSHKGNRSGSNRRGGKPGGDKNRGARGQDSRRDDRRNGDSQKNGKPAGPTKPGKPSPGKSHHRKGMPPPPHRPHFQNNTPPAVPHPGKVDPELVAKSKKAIEEWLNAGASLRAQNGSTAIKPKQDPKTLSLDPWQQEVFDLLRAGESVVVDAPTTAGKTRAVEVFFAMNIDDPTFRAAYTTPVKSLSNDKVRELRAMFGNDKIGIATGDIKENLDAPIVVATLESYRNSLLGVEPDLGRSLVIFDEYHYLQDEGRGSAWEEALILTPPSCQVLLLSASVANAAEFSEWISSLGKRRCTMVQTLHRPVPLAKLIHYGGQWLTEENIPPEAFKQQIPALREKPLRHQDIVTRLPSLLELQLTPCIIYAGKRIDCENLAREIERALPPLDEEQSTRIGASLMESHKDVGALSFIKPEMRRMLQTYGVGFHHSGLAPAARIAVERLVKDGLLRFCVATMGLSLGINFSVRSALISDYQRPGEQGMTSYAEGEVLQMLGRAGRRGKDVVGFSLWPCVEAFTRMGRAVRDPCQSRLRTDPTTLLGLIGRGLNLGLIESIYAKSFRKFQQPNTDLRLIRKPDVLNKLNASEIPCQSPAAEFARFNKDDPTNICHPCTYREKCHGYVGYRSSGQLANMHLHLHRIQCIQRDETLTELGSVARYFPQSGGLLISRMIVDGRITPDKMMAACELFAALTLPRFKEPGSRATYRFPFDRQKLERELETLYPLGLFPEVYDAPFGKRTWHQIKDFNPEAGDIVKMWLSGEDWAKVVKAGTTEVFGVGDLMGLMYRVATYLQSMAGMPVAAFKEPAKALRRELIRTPLDLTL